MGPPRFLTEGHRSMTGWPIAVALTKLSKLEYSPAVGEWHEWIFCAGYITSYFPRNFVYCFGAKSALTSCGRLSCTYLDTCFFRNFRSFAHCVFQLHFAVVCVFAAGPRRRQWTSWWRRWTGFLRTSAHACVMQRPFCIRNLHIPFALSCISSPCRHSVNTLLPLFLENLGKSGKWKTDGGKVKEKAKKILWFVMSYFFPINY